MEDNEIVNLYWVRSNEAIVETEKKVFKILSLYCVSNCVQ